MDVSRKPITIRTASASGVIQLKPSTIRIIEQGEAEKGDVLTAAKVAGILAAKNTWNTLPLCHQIPLKSVQVEAKTFPDGIEISSTVKAEYVTGVEMEALNAVTVALLTVWDMVKQYEKDDAGQYPDTAITKVRVNKKLKAEAT